MTQVITYKIRDMSLIKRKKRERLPWIKNIFRGNKLEPRNGKLGYKYTACSVTHLVQKWYEQIYIPELQRKIRKKKKWFHGKYRKAK